MPIFRVESVKIYTGQKKFTRAPLVVLVTNIRYAKEEEVQSFIYEGEATKNPLTWSCPDWKKLTKCIAWGCLPSKEEKLLWRFAVLMAFYWKLLDVKKIDSNFLFLYSSLFKHVSEEFVIDGILLRFWEIFFWSIDGTILLGCWT